MNDWRSRIVPPAELWSTIAVWAVVVAAVNDDEFMLISDARISYDSGSGEWATLVRYADDHWLLFGWDGDSETDRAVYDPLAAAPPWVPVAELRPRIGVDEVSFVHWWDGARWRRSPTDIQDGEGLLGLFMGRADFIEWVTDEDGVLPDDDGPEVIERLLRAADRGAVTAEMLGYLEPEIADVAMEYLRAAGVAAGAAKPVEPLPELWTGPASHRRINAEEHLRVLVDAMAAAAERARPEPDPTPELNAIVARMNSFQGRVDCAFRVGTFGHMALGPNSRITLPGLEELWLAESSEHGRWLFIRFEKDEHGLTIQRAYDHWPTWVDRSPYDYVVRRADIAAEVAARSEQWKPSWASIAADEYAYDLLD
ncbi:hypothetical protein [Nocardia sp. NPDC056100]|uniref:hypothetical protein n=1 Tax=Nocardia sp. NPDC056100 TaxID=3345712 RepID=UPI0035DAA86D